jgi:hypothetical protein
MIWNFCLLSERDKASAMLFIFPGICSAFNMILYCKDSETRFLTRVCLFTDSTGGRDKGFGIYFQGKWAQGCWPKEWANNGILADITFLELFPVVISVHIWGIHLKNKKDNQTFRSSRISCDTRILWWGLVTLHVAFIRRRLNALPGATTWHAKFNRPRRDCKSRRDTFRSVVLYLKNFQPLFIGSQKFVPVIHIFCIIWMIFCLMVMQTLHVVMKHWKHFKMFANSIVNAWIPHRTRTRDQ